MTHASPPGGSVHVIVIGNEKGGSGKSTTAMHVTAGLLRMGFRVGALDLDTRQRSLDRFFENRQARREKGLHVLPMPTIEVVPSSQENDREAAKAIERGTFDAAFGRVADGADFVVIDTPGAASHLSRLGHARADTLLTPINDSFVDLDLLVAVDGDTFDVGRPSVYADMVFEQRKTRLAVERKAVDWVVSRNRLSQLDAKNKQRVGDALAEVAKRQGFRLAPGVGERVIFRELFPQGLTLLDLRDPAGDARVNFSHVAARAELRALIETLNLPGIADRLDRL